MFCVLQAFNLTTDFLKIVDWDYLIITSPHKTAFSFDSYLASQIATEKFVMTPAKNIQFLTTVGPIKVMSFDNNSYASNTKASN